MNKYGSTIAPDAKEYINNKGPLRGKVNSLVNKYESQDDTTLKTRQGFKKSTSVTANALSRSRALSSERNTLLNNKNDVQFHDRSSSRDTPEDSVLLVRLVPTEETQTGGNNKWRLKHSSSSDDILSCNDHHRNAKDNGTNIFSKSRETLSRPNDYTLHDRDGTVKSPSRVQHLKKIFVSDNTKSSVENNVNTQLSHNTFSENHGLKSSSQTPRSPVTPRQTKPPCIQLSSKLNGEINYTESPRSSRCTSINGNAALLSMSNTGTKVGSNTNHSSRSRSRTRTKRGERDDSWITQRSSSVPAYTTLGTMTNDSAKEVRQHNQLSLKDTAQEGSYRGSKNLQNESQHSKRSSWSNRENNNNYEKLQPIVSKTSHCNGNRLIVANKSSNNYENLNGNLANDYEKLEVNQNHRNSSGLKNNVPNNESNSSVNANRHLNTYAKTNISSKSSNGVLCNGTIENNQTNIASRPSNHSLNRRQGITSGENYKLEIPNIHANGPDYENVKTFYKEDRSKFNATELTSDYMTGKAVKGDYFDNHNTNIKTRDNNDDPLANYFDSDMRSSRRSSALSHDAQSSLHESIEISEKYSQRHFTNCNFDYPDLKQNISENSKIRPRSSSVSSVHSAPSFRIVNIDTETTHTGLCHSESMDKLNEIHQMTAKLHVGLKDMSKSIEFLYENMNYKSKKIEHRPLEEVSYHRLFTYIAKASKDLTQHCWRHLLKALMNRYPEWFVHRKEKVIEKFVSSTGEKVHECLILWREYNQSINDENKINDLKSALMDINMPRSVIDGIDDIISSNDQECSQYANVLTDQKLSSLALEIGKEWRLLAIFLGHSHQYTERLAMDFQGNSGAAIQKMLFDWRDIHNSNVDMLVKAFISVDRKDLVEKLYTVYQLIKKCS